MAEWSKAPDSRTSPYSLIGRLEISGPLMRAGVRIPFLTKTFYKKIAGVIISFITVLQLRSCANFKNIGWELTKKTSAYANYKPYYDDIELSAVIITKSRRIFAIFRLNLLIPWITFF